VLRATISSLYQWLPLRVSALNLWVRVSRGFGLFCALVLTLSAFVESHAQSSEAMQTYLGFDRNDYPGDAYLAELRKTFSYTGYWLNNPPGANANSWRGKRQTIESAGFGFLVLFNGRLYKQIKAAGDPIAQGKADAQAATAAARSEGFPPHTIIFLDQEEGGRLLSEQRAYLLAWVDGVTAAGFGAGVYCSGIPFREGDGTLVNTADDIHANQGARKIVFWVVNDACPPSPGCSFAPHAPLPRGSGISYADVWQFAQSPRRKDVAAACSNYGSDGNCYPPGIDRAAGIHIDVSTANSADPSEAEIRSSIAADLLPTCRAPRPVTDDLRSARLATSPSQIAKFTFWLNALHPDQSAAGSPSRRSCLTPAARRCRASA
jgi:hypothetical protein